MKPKIFIDGKEGTTGLQIYERLGGRDDLELLLIDDEKRKDLTVRKELLNAADLVFLCLPDAAARESAALVENPRTRIIDASTAHRTASGWVYGFPELLAGQRQRIRFASRVANPGCHATGFLSITAPLVAMDILPPGYPVAAFSLTGYSGGGKKMIAQYESVDKASELYSPRIYGTNLKHKHLPEMQLISGLKIPPLFSPVVDDYYKGMATVIPLQTALLNGHPAAQDVCELLMQYYEDQKLVQVAPFAEDAGLLAANAFSGYDNLEISVSGHEDQILLVAQFDNLGKGASGAAVQNMNLMLGLEEFISLKIKETTR